MKDIITHWANNPYITCDTNRCGQCAKEKIRSEVAKECLGENKGKYTIEDVKYIETTTKNIWESHPIYLKYQDFKSKGLTMEQAFAELRKEGIEP